MKVNEWINQKFWQSIFIRLAASVADVVRVQATLQHTAKLCPEMICGKAFNLYYICILYSLDIAIALKVVLMGNWLILKTSAIHSWTKMKLIVPIAKQKNGLPGSITQETNLVRSTPNHIERCNYKLTI